jgi:excisionase family DNA binding protein
MVSLITYRNESEQRRNQTLARKVQEPLVYEQLSLDGFRVQKGYYTTREVAELYKVSQDTVVKWVKRGWMDAHRLDGKKKAGNYRIHPQCIEDIERATEDLIRQNRRLLVMAYGKARRATR